MKISEMIDKKYLKSIKEYKNEIKDWEKIKINENNEELVSLHGISEKIIVKPQYYINNILGAENDCRVRKTVAYKLNKIAEKLPNGYKLLVWDGYRKIATQKSLYDTFFQKVKNENANLTKEEQEIITKKFVSFPSYNINHPSPHNTGAAIDLTICDNDGNEINMGTYFDDFSEKSKTMFFENKKSNGYKLSNEDEEIILNRRILCNLFSEEGFVNYPYEIWHKSYNDQMSAKILGLNHAEYGSIELI